ncbi:MAG: RecQ family zinc-binding domain-containing protein, partial [Clostridia bacterium]
LDNELNAMVSFLENDQDCRRQRIVAAFNPYEKPPLEDNCCDVCQVEKGLGHPWLEETIPVHYRGELRSAEMEIFTTLSENMQTQDALIQHLKIRIQGNHLAHEERIGSYLQGLKKMGLSALQKDIWTLSQKGMAYLEDNKIPSWNEVMTGGME